MAFESSKVPSILIEVAGRGHLIRQLIDIEVDKDGLQDAKTGKQKEMKRLKRE